MPPMNVNATRMELQNLRNKLRIAVKGHKLLKDKFDEMMRQFNARIKENKVLREEIETKLHSALRAFLVARTRASSQQIEDALLLPAVSCGITTGTTNIMGLNIPKIDATVSQSSVTTDASENLLQKPITTLQQSFADLIKLAETEKACEMLATEIEKNRRRINALEHILIPETRETIKFISFKLGENERQNIARLLRIKNAD